MLSVLQLLAIIFQRQPEIRGSVRAAVRRRPREGETQEAEEETEPDEPSQQRGWTRGVCRGGARQGWDDRGWCADWERTSRRGMNKALVLSVFSGFHLAIL